jgi:imidazolonepropionase-like amidohydrolase
VTGERITEIGPSKQIKPPAEAQVVDATGKYLVPGLWDMHVHWFLKDYLPLFIANGVTGVRHMWGFPLYHQWRKDVEEGTFIGPRMVIASPIIDGPDPIWNGSVAVGNEAEAREAVRKSKRDGADFIKVYSRLPRDAFFAIADEAKTQGLGFAGHVPSSVSAVEASDAGQQTVEHLTGILAACSAREEDLRKGIDQAFSELPKGRKTPSPAKTRPLTRLSLETFSPEKAAAVLARLKRNHTWQCPTLTVLRSTSHLDDATFRNDPRLKYMPAQVKNSWNPATDFRFRERTPEDFELARLVYKKQLEIVGMMQRAGVGILAGTDVINPYCFPGFSLHDELVLLVQSGLTPMQALQAATINPARFLGKEKEMGTIEKGKIADLVLLDANPLEEIANTQKIHAVVFNGKLIPKPALQEMLAKIEAAAGK